MIIVFKKTKINNIKFYNFYYLNYVLNVNLQGNKVHKVINKTSHS